MTSSDYVLQAILDFRKNPEDRIQMPSSVTDQEILYEGIRKDIVQPHSKALERFSKNYKLK